MVNKFITYVPSCMRKRGKRILGVKFKKGVSDSVPSCKIYIQQSAALFVCGPRSLFILCFTWFWKNPSYSFQWLTFLFPNYLSQFIQWKTIPFWFPTLDFSTTSSLHIIRSGKNIYLISVFSRIWFSINTYLDLFYALLDYEKNPSYNFWCNTNSTGFFWSSKDAESHNTKLREVLIEVIKATISKLNEIWQVKGK